MDQESRAYRQRVDEAVAYLKRKNAGAPEIVIILGTGLGDLAGLIDKPLVMPYPELPGFPRTTVPGHAGNLILGDLAGRRVAILQGRFHYYEGYSARELTMPLRVLSLLGAATLIVTNAAGGLNPDFTPGTLMLIRDHLNFIPDNPLRGPNIDQWGPRFPDLSQAYDPQLLGLALAEAEGLGLAGIAAGNYCAIPGPSLETPAETRFLRNSGGDAVGMSTVPEVIVARHAGMKVLGISVIANVNDPDNFRPIVMEEVISRAGQAAAGLERLIAAIIADL